MLRLILMRHGKAVPESALGDHARALAPRGLAQARRVGQYLAEEGLLPEVVLASDSARTLQTYENLGLAPGQAAISSERALYLASPRALLAKVHVSGKIARHVMVIGHNPGLAELGEILTGYGDRYAVARMRQKFPPGALAVLDYDGQGWEGVAARKCRLDRFIRPADLDGETDD